MRLLSLELSGFKSFAKKTTISFDVPITAIVGPNGSGKSNVAEGLRFGLAEQSMKSMRGKRGEDLIFSGTASVPRGNRASVALSFDNRDRFFEHVDFDEVVLERVVFRDGTNDYLINGGKVRLKDVQELLARANVGETGHHIISQGEADRVLSAHPRERRAMIEEALGLRYYQYKKAEAEKKLEKTEENIREVASLRREIAPHLKFLASQVERAEKHGEMKRELITLYQTYFSHEKAYLRDERARIQKERQEPERLAAELRAFVETFRETAPETNEGDVRTLEEHLERARREEREILQEVAKFEGVLSALLGGSRGDSVTLPRKQIEDMVHHVKEVRSAAGSAESSTILRTMILDLVQTIETFFSRHTHSHGGSEEVRSVEKNITTLKEKLSSLQDEREKQEGEVRRVRESALRAHEDARAKDRELYEKKAKLAECEVVLARLSGEERALSERKNEFEREESEAAALVGHDAFSYPEHRGDVSLREQEVRQRDLERMKIRVEEFAGAGSDVLKEYEETKTRDAFLTKELEDLSSSERSLEELIQDLEAELNTIFTDGLVKINTSFNEYFEILFGGGSAKLTVTEIQSRGMDEEGEEVEEGIDISVTVPKKRVKGLTALSGGERALTSIALIFAMSSVNPPPFLILDETDAALDEANSRRYGDMIESLAKKSQLIVITHNRETMSRAGILYGVTMGNDGVSKLLSVKFEEAVAVAK
jgi:chromosome segregation protein